MCRVYRSRKKGAYVRLCSRTGPLTRGARVALETVQWSESGHVRTMFSGHLRQAKGPVPRCANERCCQALSRDDQAQGHSHCRLCREGK